MDKKYRSTGYILRVSSLVLACTGILYIALHRHVTLSHNAKRPLTLPAIVENEKVLSQGHNFYELRRNLTLLTNKVNGLFTFLKRNGLDLSGIEDASDFARMNTNSSTTQSMSLLTLFTTLQWSKDREVIFNNTLLNWASFRPVVKPVLFTDDAVATERARMYGWTVMNLTKTSSNGLPVLKYMYISAMKSSRSQYYCFANSDILFDGGLIKSLVNIHYTIPSPLKHVFITGKRFNVVNVTKSDVSKRQDIKSLVNTRGELFSSSAEDYFITDKLYPWESIPEVVVACPAYDNWLVMNARANNHFVVDATKTVTIVHQSVDENNHRSHTRDTAAYNANLLRDQYKINVPYHKGFIDCIERFTDALEDTFVIRERTVDSYCN